MLRVSVVSTICSFLIHADCSPRLFYGDSLGYKLTYPPHSYVYNISNSMSSQLACISPTESVLSTLSHLHLLLLSLSFFISFPPSQILKLNYMCCISTPSHVRSPLLCLDLSLCSSTADRVSNIHPPV